MLPPDNATGNYTKVVQRIPVKIALDDPRFANKLRPGLSVTVIADPSVSLPVGVERAVFLDTISPDAIAGALERLISNDTERLALQRRGWESSPFDIVRTTRQLDDLRGAIMQASPGR